MKYEDVTGIVDGHARNLTQLNPCR